MALIYIFKNLFNFWLERRQLDSYIFSCIWSVTKYCFGWSIWRKSGLTNIHNWKREEHFNSLFTCCGYLSLMPHPNSTGGSLRVSFTVESEAMSANFTCSVLLPYWLVYLVFWMQCLSTCNFAISRIDHFENAGSLNYADLPNVNILLTISENLIS